MFGVVMFDASLH
jgi:hypothetical protein